jgi:hypothetical protein
MEVAMSIFRDLAVFTQSFAKLLLRAGSPEKLLTFSAAGDFIIALVAATEIVRQIKDDSVVKDLSSIRERIEMRSEGQSPGGWTEDFWLIQRVLLKGGYDIKLLFDSIGSVTQLTKTFMNQSEENTGHNNNKENASQVVKQVAYCLQSSALKDGLASEEPSVAPYDKYDVENSAAHSMQIQDIVEEKTTGDIGGGEIQYAESQKEVILLEEKKSDSEAISGNIQANSAQVAENVSNGRSSPITTSKTGGVASISGALIGGVAAGAAGAAPSSASITDSENRGDGKLHVTIDEFISASKPPIESKTFVQDLALLDSEKNLQLVDLTVGGYGGVDGQNAISAIALSDGDTAGTMSGLTGSEIDITCDDCLPFGDLCVML